MLWSITNLKHMLFGNNAAVDIIAIQCEIAIALDSMRLSGAVPFPAAFAISKEK